MLSSGRGGRRMIARVPQSALRSLLSLGRFMLGVARWRAAYMLALLLVGSLTEGFSIVLLIPIVEIAGAGHVAPPPYLARFAPLGLGPMLLIFVAVMVLRALLMRQTQLDMTAIAGQVINAMRTGLFRSIAFARWGYIANLRTADMDHALGAELNRVAFVIQQVFEIARSGVLLVIYAGISAAISPAMTLLAAGFGGVLFAVMRPLRVAAARHGERFSEQMREQHRIIAGFLASIKVAKSFNAEPEYVRRLSLYLDLTMGSNLKFTEILANGALISQFLTAAGLAGFAYVSLVWAHLAFARMILLLLVFMRLSPRMTAIQSSFHQVTLNLPAYQLVRLLAEDCERHQEPAQAARGETVALAQGLRFEAVGFSYDESGRQHLQDASFEIPARRVTALIGPSGSGKSTIADLILGLIEPQTGRILIDGVALEASGHRAWREAVAYVPQEVFLMHDTIAANLALANPAADEAQMWAALEAANARGFVEALPEKLATVVGERGLRLSGGERQRIALARALLRKPLLLILDEGTSALDWENQALVARSIEGLSGAMTVLTIAHRPSMIAFADWVIAVEAGRVTETGPYAQVMAKPGSYLGKVIAEERMS